MTDPEPALPGEDLIQRGLEDLAAGVESVESLLVSIALCVRTSAARLNQYRAVHAAEEREPALW
jgi:hypothetical protein